MRIHKLLKTSLVLAVALAATGCAGRSPASPEEKKEPTYGQAMKAMYPDALKAMKSTMPGVEVEEIPGGRTECGGSDLVDNQDAGKLIASATIRLPGDPSDKRTSADLIEEMTGFLQEQGWAVGDHQKNAGLRAIFSKDAGAGSLHVSAEPFRLTSGKISQTLIAKVITDCLRNPEWKGK